MVRSKAAQTVNNPSKEGKKGGIMKRLSLFAAVLLVSGAAFAHPDAERFDYGPSIGAQSGDTITLDLHVINQTGADAGLYIKVEVTILDEDWDQAKPGDFYLSVGSAGYLTEGTGSKAVFLTNAYGVVDIVVTDARGGSGRTIFVKYEGITLGGTNFSGPGMGFADISFAD